MANTQSAGTIAGPATGSMPAPPGLPGPSGPAGRSRGPGGSAGRPERRRWSTPARMWGGLIAVAVSVLLLTAAAALTVQSEATSARQTGGPVEAQAVNAQQLYYALSDADAAAATGILDSPAPPARFTDRYQADITEADDALASIAVDVAGDQSASTDIQHLDEQLSEYTGLIGTAQANNRQQFPVGGAYLREASNLLEGTMLPEAQSVLGAEKVARSASASNSGGIAYWPLLAALLVLAAGVWSWRLLAERTRRAVNAGLAVALLGALVVVGWSATASARAGSDMTAASTDFQQLAAAQQARGDVARISANEASSVVSQGADNGSAANKGHLAFLDLGAQLGQVEAADPGAKTGDANLYAQIKADVAEIQGDAGSGDYPDATVAMVGTGATAGGALVHFDALANSLAASEQRFQAGYQRDTDAAAADYPGGPWPIVLVGLLAAALAGYGVNRRIAEYR
jgi:hypothetical protein